MNFNALKFQQKLSDNRLEQAKNLFGDKIVLKILAFALFLLGATRSSIASFLNMPSGSIRSLIRSLNYMGLAALEDQRSSRSSFKASLPPDITPYIEISEPFLDINLGIGNRRIRIPQDNLKQKRVVLLTLLNSDLLTRSQVADVLNLSTDRTGKLAVRLDKQDVSAILDQRQGQQKDYLFTPEIKAELIQQFIIDIFTQGSTSGEQLSKGLQKRCNLKLAPRSILYHISRLGLSGIKTSLPAHLDRLKKTP